MYAKSRNNPEHQYWPDQNRPIRQRKSVLSDFVPYWQSCTISITKAVFILLCKYTVVN